MGKKKRIKAKAETVKAVERPKGGIRPAWQWVVPALAVLVFVCYWNSIHGEFQFDDSRVIRFNFSLRDMARWLDIFRSEMYRPLLVWSFALNFKIGGQDPFSYHLFNVIFHATSICLFYVLLSRQTSSRWLPITAAALMAVHPLNTESVSYISSRSTVLCSVFYLSALLFYDSYLRSSRKPFAVAYLLCFLLGATVKEEAAMIPLAAFAYRLICHGRNSIRKNLWLDVTAGMILVAGGIFRVLMQLKQGAPPYLLSTWIPTQISVWLRYLWLALYPVPLNVDPDIAAIGFSNPAFWISALVIAGLCAVAWRARKANPFIAFWLFWYLLNLLPSSVFPLQDFMAEHRTYLSNFGFAACAGYFLIDFCLPRIRSAPVLALIVCLLVSSYSFATIHRNSVWMTNITLWSDSVQKSPQKPRPHLNLAASYLKHLEYDLAIREFLAALALDSSVPQAHSGLGICYLKGKGDLKLAEASFQQALRLQPDLTDAKTGLGTVFFRQKKYAEAVQLFEQIYPQRQESIEVVAMMSDSYLHLKDFDRAIQFLKRGIELDPQTPGWYYHLMEAYFVSGRLEEAGRIYDQYSTAFPKSSQTRFLVAEMLVRIGRVQDATKILQELTKDPALSLAAQERLRALSH
jgi:Tfp pilus assembly protein PilF